MIKRFLFSCFITFFTISLSRLFFRFFPGRIETYIYIHLYRCSNWWHVAFLPPRLRSLERPEILRTILKCLDSFYTLCSRFIVASFLRYAAAVFLLSPISRPVASMIIHDHPRLDSKKDASQTSKLFERSIL